jgi:[CysO sulfur-carrier protein]-S-L-cysteine hydrolase
MLRGLFLNKSHWVQMEEDIIAKAPEEACGIILGEDNQSQIVIPITNILHSSTRFRMEPKEQLVAFLLAEEKSLEILAIYHSHPQGIDKPSITDLEELTYPEIFYLIWYSTDSIWNCRVYLMTHLKQAIEVPVIISDNK